jgi:hypothetical protein
MSRKNYKVGIFQKQEALAKFFKICPPSLDGRGFMGGGYFCNYLAVIGNHEDFHHH